MAEEPVADAGLTGWPAGGVGENKRLLCKWAGPGIVWEVLVSF